MRHVICVKVTSHPHFPFSHTEKQRAQFPVPLTDFRRHRKGSLRLQRKFVCLYLCALSVYMCACDCTHPPKVLAVGVSGDAVGRVDLAHQGTEASSFGDVLSAAHTGHLHEDAQKRQQVTQQKESEDPYTQF